MGSDKSRATLDQHGQFLKYYLLIGVLAFVVYANSLSNDFVFDDDSVVLSDPTIMTLSSIPKYFTGQEGFHKVIGKYWRPVISASYAIDYSLWGFNPLGFHLTNIIIHIINCLLFFKILLLMFPPGVKKKTKQYEYALLASAVVFAVHPIHTEAVTWVSGRTDSLSFTFFVAAFIYYLKYSSSSNVKRADVYIIMMSIFYILALLAKEMAITLPAAIIMYDILTGKVNSLNELKKKAFVYSLLVILSFLYLFSRWLVLKDVPERVTYFYFYGKDFATTLLTMLQTLPLYFRLLIVPVGLVYHYSGYLPYVNSFANLNVLFAMLFIIVMIAFIFFFYKRSPIVSYAILFFFLTLLPVLNIVPTMNFMAERFLYIPSMMVSLFIVVLLFQISSLKSRNVFYTLTILLIAVYSFLTIQRNPDWKSNDALFMSAEGKPGTVTYVNIGNIYANKNEIDKAEIYYRKAIDLRDESLIANNNLGKVFMVRGNYDSAYYYINKAYYLDTLSPEPMFTLAQLYSRFNKIPEAITELEKIQKITPNYMNSVQLLEQLKKPELPEQPNTQADSTQNAQLISQLDRESFNDYQNKRYETSIKKLQQLVKLNPSGAAGYYNNIGVCYMNQNQLEDAKKYFELASEEKADFSMAFNNLGTVYDKLGDKDKAKEFFLKAIEADPNNQNAKDNYQKIK